MLTPDKIFSYVWQHFCSVYPDAGKLELRTREDLTDKVEISENGMHFFKKLLPFPENAAFKNWNGREVPVFFSENHETEIITEESGKIRINFDLISAAFYLLSGWQEYYSDARDRFGRFPYKSSIQEKYNFITIPVVNYYFDILRAALEKAYGISLKTETWNGKPFVTFLSHDIDRLESAWKIEGLKQLKSGNIRNTISLLRQKLSRYDHWNNLETVAKTVKKYSAVSTFFWLANKGKTNSHPNADYNITEKKYQELIQKLQADGFENSIHGSFGSSENAEQLNREAAKLNKPVTGNRFHYLCFNPKKTPNVLEKAGIEYDSTLGFAEQFGFRNSYCFPFYPFNFEKSEPHSFLEIPINLMDATLWHPNYLQIPAGKINSEIERMLLEIKKFGGIFGLLWHNENFSEYNVQTGLKVFEEIMQQLSGMQSHFMTGAQISSVFRQKL